MLVAHMHSRRIPRPVARGFSRCGRTPSQINGPQFYQNGPLFCLNKPKNCQIGPLFCLKNHKFVKKVHNFAKKVQYFVKKFHNFVQKNHPVEVSGYGPDTPHSYTYVNKINIMQFTES